MDLWERLLHQRQAPKTQAKYHRITTELSVNEKSPANRQNFSRWSMLGPNSRLGVRQFDA